MTRPSPAPVGGSGLSEGARVGLFLAAFFAAGAVFTAFLPLWLADRGLDPATIGLVLGLASLSRVVGVPGWGWAADRVGRQRLMLFAAAVSAGLCIAALPAAGQLPAIFALVIAGGIAASALTPLSDALTLALAAARRLEYGRTRAWGSAAYMVATATGGLVLGRVGIVTLPWMVAAAYGVAAMLTPALPVTGRHAARSAKPTPLGRPFRLTLLATALIQGSHAAYYAFASLHWHASGIADGAIGLLIAEGVVAEVALFIWGRRLVDRLGPSRLTAIAAGCCLVRWTVTAATAAVPVLVVIQILHAGTFAFQHLSSMWVLRTLPPGRAGVAQTVLSALGFSAPTGVLIWLSGRIYGEAGGMVFLLMAAVGGSALLVAPHLPGAARQP